MWSSCSIKITVKYSAIIVHIVIALCKGINNPENVNEFPILSPQFGTFSGIFAEIEIKNSIFEVARQKK